jgi:hypothetical protein
MGKKKRVKNLVVREIGDKKSTKTGFQALTGSK